MDSVECPRDFSSLMARLTALAQPGADGQVMVDPGEARFLVEQIARKASRNQALAVERDAALARLAELEEKEELEPGALELLGRIEALGSRCATLEGKDSMREAALNTAAQAMSELANRMSSLEARLPRVSPARTGKKKVKRG